MLFRSFSALAVTALLVAGSLSAQTMPQATDEPVASGRQLSELVADLKAPAPLTRNAAAYEIAGLGPAAAPAVPALIEALDDEAPAVRFPVIVALGEIGPDAAAAVPRLQQVMEEDFNDEIAAAARRAIKRIRPQALSQE